jgi:hypothetical protein
LRLFWLGSGAVSRSKERHFRVFRVEGAYILADEFRLPAISRPVFKERTR